MSFSKALKKAKASNSYEFRNADTLHGYWALGPTLRKQVDDAVASWVKSGKATLGKSSLAKPVTTFSDLLAKGKKRRKPPGKGWQPIPRSKKGGWRKRNAKGGWDYWYPGEGDRAGVRDEDVSGHAMKLVDEQGNVTYHKKVHRKGKYIYDPSNFRRGSAFEMTRNGKRGHIEIIGRKGGTLTVHHSGTGEDFTISARALSAELKRQHASSIESHERAVKKELREAVLYGTAEQFDALYDQAKTYGIDYDPGYKDPDAAHGQVQPSNYAQTLHRQILPKLYTKTPKDVVNFSNPTKKAKRLFNHQVEAAARIVQAWQGARHPQTGEWAQKPRDGFMLQDAAGLGKTHTCLAAIKANGGKRNLVIVPTKGKAGLLKQWTDSAKLHGLDMKSVRNFTDSEGKRIKGAGDAAKDEDGTFIAAYNDIFDVEYKYHENGDPIFDAKTGKHAFEIKMRPEFAGKWDTISFDESHNMRLPQSKKTIAAMQLQERADKVLYMSATPFTGIRDMHYLRRLGTEADGWFRTPEEFTKWAASAGAKLQHDSPGEGDLPIGVTNPTSPAPLTMVAAKMHFEGVGMKREPLYGAGGVTVNAHFSLIKPEETAPEHAHMFNLAAKITELVTSEVRMHPETKKQKQKALDESFSAGDLTEDQYLAESEKLNAVQGLEGFQVGGIMSMWHAHMWEVAKAGRAIEQAKKELAEGRQVFITTKRITHNNDALTGFDAMLEARVQNKEIHPSDAAKLRRKLQGLLGQMPPLKFEYTDPDTGKVHKGKNLMEMMANALGGPDEVAQVHGAAPTTDSKGNPVTAVSEQEAYQAGKKKVCIGSMSKAGTGLSFHDDEGMAPRTQINMTLPSTGSLFEQVSGRSHRLGSKSDTRMVWLAGDHRNEMMNARLCYTKMLSMGALTAGDPSLLIKSSPAETSNWANGMSDDNEESIDKLVETLVTNNGDERDLDRLPDLEELASEGEDHFKWAVNKLNERKDPIKLMGARLGETRSAKELSRRRMGVAKLAMVGIHTRQASSHLHVVTGAHEGTEGYEAFKKTGYGAKYNKDTKEWVIYDQWALKRAADHLGFHDVGKKLKQQLADHNIDAALGDTGSKMILPHAPESLSEQHLAALRVKFADRKPRPASRPTIPHAVRPKRKLNAKKISQAARRQAKERATQRKKQIASEQREVTRKKKAKKRTALVSKKKRIFAELREAGYSVHRARAELKRRLAAEGTEKSQGPFMQALLKAVTHASPPPGYEPIPGSKHGGFRKKVGGGYDYWYPTEGHASRARAHREKAAESTRKKLGKMLKKRGKVDQAKMSALLDEHASHSDIADAHGKGSKGHAEHESAAKDKEQAERVDQTQAELDKLLAEDADGAGPQQQDPEHAKRELDARKKVEKKHGVDKHRDYLAEISAELVQMNREHIEATREAGNTKGRKQAKAEERAESAEKRAKMLEGKLKEAMRSLKRLERMVQATAQQDAADEGVRAATKRAEAGDRGKGAVQGKRRSGKLGDIAKRGKAKDKAKRAEAGDRGKGAVQGKRRSGKLGDIAKRGNYDMDGPSDPKKRVPWLKQRIQALEANPGFNPSAGEAEAARLRKELRKLQGKGMSLADMQEAVKRHKKTARKSQTFASLVRRRRRDTV